jgi:hypothetical protein
MIFANCVDNTYCNYDGAKTCDCEDWKASWWMHDGCESEASQKMSQSVTRPFCPNADLTNPKVMFGARDPRAT